MELQHFELLLLQSCIGDLAILEHTLMPTIAITVIIYHNFPENFRKISRNNMDKFWLHQLVKFDFTADLTGTGNRSGVVIS